jgi:hypothetical protein
MKNLFVNVGKKSIVNCFIIGSYGMGKGIILLSKWDFKTPKPVLGFSKDLRRYINYGFLPVPAGTCLEVVDLISLNCFNCDKEYIINGNRGQGCPFSNK